MNFINLHLTLDAEQGRPYSAPAVIEKQESLTHFGLNTVNA